MREHKILKVRRHHDGIDIKTPLGSNIYATTKGEIVFSGIAGGYGKTIKIKHANGYESRYAHLHEIMVEKGQQVIKGSIIGLVGNTGLAGEPHLHFGLIKDDKPMNPLEKIDASKLSK